MTDVAVLIVSYNAADHLERCLATVDEGLGQHTGQIILIDNASTDGAPEVARRARPDATIEVLAENIGFGRAMNRAARRADAPWLLLLNPDTEVEPGAIGRLIDFACSRPDAGLFGGLTVDADGRPDGMHCWGRPTPWSLTCFGLGLTAARPHDRRFNPEAHGRWPTDRPYVVDAITGAFLLIGAKPWSDLGGFAEEYFLYGEDLDLCTRAVALGYQPTVTPDARIRHAVGASSAGRPDRRVAVLRGKVTYLRAHWSPMRRRYGRAMLRLGVLLRRTLGRDGWDEVWRRRHEWLAGYPARPAGIFPEPSTSSGTATRGETGGRPGTEAGRRSRGDGPSSDA